MPLPTNWRSRFSTNTPWVGRTLFGYSVVKLSSRSGANCSALAGPVSVRGYRDSRLYGDRGLTWRNELAFPFTAALGTPSPLGLRPFVGADFGKVWAHGAADGGSLSGWTAGLGLNYAPVSLQLSFSGAGPRSASVPSDHMFFARFAAGF